MARHARQRPELSHETGETVARASAAMAAGKLWCPECGQSLQMTVPGQPDEPIAADVSDLTRSCPRCGHVGLRPDDRVRSAAAEPS